jgi:hypothetical protein
MPKGIVIAAVLILAAMLAVKDGRLPRRAGLTASCVVAQQDADGSQIVACRAGALEGRPNLTARSCRADGASGTYAYWLCPAAQAQQIGG